MKRAVFLDKDGTLIEDVPYNVDPRKIRLAEGAAEGLRELKRAGYLLIVVSNQSGIAHGFFDERALSAAERRLRAILAASGAPLDGFYFCPHHPDGKMPGYSVACDCRKPKPGLLLRAAAEHGVDLAVSWLVGDILDDVEAGRRADCRTVLLLNGHETEWQLTADRWPHHVSANLATAARLILRASEPVVSSIASRFQTSGLAGARPRNRRLGT